MIRLAEGFDLPVDAATQGFAFLARRGAGKSYAAGVLAEGLIGAGVPTLVLDPVGIWWGLRLAADGKTQGLPVPVMGGLHGDVALREESGADVARILSELGSSAVLDVSSFRKAGRKRFVTDFAEELFALKKRHRAPLHLVIEEAQMFAPQRSGAGDARMLGAIEDLCRLGRNFGIGFTLISQRPQSVNKEVLSQVECLVVMQTTGPHERKAIEAWIHEKGLDVAEMLAEVPSLPIGEGFLWSPQWLGRLERVRIRQKTTYDASSTPTVGARPVHLETARQAGLEEVVAALEAGTAAPEEEPAAAAEPRRGKRGRSRGIIQDHHRSPELATGAKVEALEVVDAALRATLADRDRTIEGLLAAIERGVDVLQQQRRGLAALEAEASRIEELLMETWRSIVHAAEVENPRPAAHRAIRQLAESKSPLAGVDLVVRLARREPMDGSARLRAGARRMLEALARFPGEGLTRQQVGTLARMSTTGGTFSTYLSNLRTADLVVEEGDRLRATPVGLAAAGDVGHPQGTEELFALWSPRLRDGARRMLRHLVDHHPRAFTREELGDAAALEISGGTFSTYLSNLRSNGLIEEEGGRLRAASVFFVHEGRP